MKDQHFLAIYNFTDLNVPESFEELARLLSFEQIIHMAFDGIYSKVSDNTQKTMYFQREWLELVEVNIEEDIRRYCRDLKGDQLTLARDYYVSKMIEYTTWLGAYQIMPDLSDWACVDNVILNRDNTVYIYGIDFLGMP